MNKSSIILISTVVFAFLLAVGLVVNYNLYTNAQGRELYRQCLVQQEQLDTQYLLVIKNSDKNFLSASRPDLHCSQPR